MTGLCFSSFSIQNVSLERQNHTESTNLPGGQPLAQTPKSAPNFEGLIKSADSLASQGERPLCAALRRAGLPLQDVCEQKL